MEVTTGKKTPRSGQKKRRIKCTQQQVDEGKRRTEGKEKDLIKLLFTLHASLVHFCHHVLEPPVTFPANGKSNVHLNQLLTHLAIERTRKKRQPKAQLFDKMHL